jgi:threonine aldolase
VHCDVRGSEVILGDNSHIGISTIGGVHPRTVRNNPDGTMDVDSIVAAIRHKDGALYYPTTWLTVSWLHGCSSLTFDANFFFA